MELFGPETEKAVKTFQRSVDITVDGVPGPFTFTELFK
ncbi:peptidoglycan-binding domain-containing protein [Gracilibacillus boraciitolerans]|nr:peptidoglycan-binding domain-containing protein [Gracilibacillus boraciitolerans]